MTNANVFLSYSPNPGSDDNANPSASLGDEHQQQLTDNYR